MAKGFRRFLSLALTLLMVLTSVPQVFATEIEGTPVPTETTPVESETPAETPTAEETPGVEETPAGSETPTVTVEPEETPVATEEPVVTEPKQHDEGCTLAEDHEGECVVEEPVKECEEGCTLEAGHEGECVVEEPVKECEEGCTLEAGHESECEVPCALTKGCILGAGHEDECLVEKPCTKKEGCELIEGHPGDCTGKALFGATMEVANKAELDTALKDAQDGDIIRLKNDIDYSGTSSLTIDKAITLDLNGFELTIYGTYGGLLLKSGCTLTSSAEKRGTLHHKGTVTAIKAWDVAAIENVDIIVDFKAEGKVIGGIVLQEDVNTKVNSIKNVSITGGGLTNGIETYNCGAPTNPPVIDAMENVTIEAVGVAMNISAPCGTATDCEFKGGVSGIEIWIKGNYSASLDLVDCDVYGGKQAVFAHDEFTDNPVTNNGTIKLTADEATTFDAASGVKLTLKIARIDENTQLILPDKLKEAFVAKVGDTYYATLASAVAAANAVTGGATVELQQNVTLGEKLTISGNVTISGEHTITRADDYPGTLFAVNAGATLTLGGGLVIDGANEYVFGKEAYEADLNNWQESIPAADSAKWFTPEEGAPVATAYMITTSGTVNLNEVTIKNHYSTNGSGIVSASKGAKVTLEGAQITHNASTSGSGLVVNASAGVWSREEELITVTMNEGTVIDGNHVGGNHGIFKIYMGTYFTMNGGEVKNTTGWNSNGTVVGIYNAVFTMNGGTICSNSSVYGPSNGRNAAIYGHSNHLFTMNGGTVCHNTGRSKAGIDSPYSEIDYTGSTIINGGTVVENKVIGTWTEPDVSGGATLTINGGTFSTDVSNYLAPDTGLVYNEDTKTYSLTKDLYEYNGTPYNKLAEVIKAIKGAPAVADAEGSEAPVVKVTASHKVDEAIVIDVDMTLDLNGCTITGVDVYPVIRVQGGANVTVKDGAKDPERVGSIVNATDYVFVLGASDSTSAGNLTIESGSYMGQTTIASVTKGELTVKGGKFQCSEGDYGAVYMLNCVDANYKNGTAKIKVEGGEFYSFNPAANAVEGNGTNFVSKGYTVENVDNWYNVVPNMIFKLHLIDSTTGNPASIPYLEGNDPAALVKTGKFFYADYYDVVLEVLDDYELDESIVIDYPMTVNLNGKTITTAATAADVYIDAFTILADVTVIGNGIVDARPSHSYAFYIGEKKVDGTKGNLTIKDGTFYGDTSAAQVSAGSLAVEGGIFEATEYDGNHDFTLNCWDTNFKNGTAEIVVKGGKFYKFNPAANAAEGAGTNFLDGGCVVEEADDGWFNVNSYAAWVKAELLAGNNVKLDRDVVINDYDLVNALKLPSNGNGKYNEEHGNGAVFHVIKPDVVLDLNGHSITWDAHDDDYCNQRQVSLFMVTITGNAGETSSLTVKDSVGTGKVDVYGMGTGMYVVGVGAKGTVEGGTWTNYPCKTCKASNIFMYPSHGAVMEITGGTFEQRDSQYLLGWKGSTTPTTNNGAGTDFDETKIEVTGGTFINFNPETDTKFFDNANNSAESESNGCADGFASAEVDGQFTVKPCVTVTFDDVTMVEGNELPKFTYTTNFTEIADDGEMLVVGEPVVEVDGAGEYEITAEAYVLMSKKYLVKVIPGTLTVQDANVEMDGVKYATIKDALWTLKSADTTVHKLKVLKDHEIDVNYSTYNYPILINGFAVEIDLNGKTITADWSKYTGSRVDNALIGVANGGKLDMIDSVGGGKIVNNDDKDNVENRIFWIMTSTADKSIVVNIKGGTYEQNETNTALLYVQGNKPSDNLAPIYVTIEGGHFETVNDDFFNAYDGYQHESYIKGGTFNKNPDDWEIKLHPGYRAMELPNGLWGVEEWNYEIHNVEDLMFFAKMVNDGDNFAGKTVKLMDDIDLVEVEEWSPIGGDSVYFAGEFAGEGHTISNLTQTTGARMGLFGMIEKAYIHDLTLKDVKFTVNENSARVGAIAGNLQHWNVLEDITIDGIEVTVNGNDGLIGSVAGYVWKSQLGNVDVKDAVYTVNGTGNVIGGHTAYGRAHVWDTNVTGNNAHWLDGTVQTIEGTEYVLQNYFEDCDVVGVEIKLIGTGSEVGGFIGSDTYNSHSNYFVDCHVTGLDVTAAEGTSQTVGGFIAWNNGSTAAGTVKGFEGCSATGTIKGANGIYGGFAGQVGGRACEYYNATADVDITSTGIAGGFVGATQAYANHKYTFTNCTASGNVTGNVAGGFAGKNGMSGDGKSVFVEYNNNTATGKVTAAEIAGGFIGEVNTELPATNWNIVDSAGSLVLNSNKASVEDKVSGLETVGYLIGYLDGVANGDAKEGNTVKVALVDNAPDGSDIGTDNYHHINVSEDTLLEDIVECTVKVIAADQSETKYKTLADAIVEAKAGDTIVFLTDIIEDVTVGKSVTIDGAGKKYTGNIAVTGTSTEATVKNVNFVDGTDYAITTNRINTITVEDCTVSNCAGFLYANKSTPTVNVKNVTVEGGNYGFHWVYGTTATLENVKMTNVTKGLYIQNYAGKTINLKNCDICSINIWERSGKSGVQTFNFEGANTVGSLTDSQYAKYVLAAADATLTAPAGYDVTTDVADSAVKYEDGMYSVATAVAKIGDVVYGSLEDALAVAQADDTVVMLSGAVAADKYVIIDSGVKLDLNGNAVEAENVLCFGNIIDTADTVGSLKVTRLILDNENDYYLPIKDTTTGAYEFYEYKLVNKGSKAITNGTKFGFAVYFYSADGYSALSNLLADENNDNDVKVIVDLKLDNKLDRIVRHVFSKQTVMSFCSQAQADANNNIEVDSMTKTMTVSITGIEEGSLSAAVMLTNTEVGYEVFSEYKEAVME